MTNPKHRFRRTGLPCAAATVLVTALSTSAMAQDSTIGQPGRHPQYAVEVEPHALVGWDDMYGGNGIGAGLRFSVPIVENGFVKSIDDSVAIGFGVDWLSYSDCYYASRCGANYLLFPVALQWNFFLTPHWSVFGEGGAFVYTGFFGECDAPGCNEPTSFGVRPLLAVGGRYHFSDNVALTLRAGYPTISVGISFL